MGANTSQDQISRPSDHSSDTSHNLKGTATTTVSAAPTSVEQLISPHNNGAVVKEADSPLENFLNKNLHAGVSLNQKKKKYWNKEKSKMDCFMVYARDLSITWSNDNRYWQWLNLKDTTTSENLVDVAELVNVCWLEVHGNFEMGMLSPGVVYQVSFVVMLKDPAYGWDFPVNFRLTLPDRTVNQQKQILMEIPRGQWIEIPVGEVDTRGSSNLAGKMEFSMYECEGGKWKKGLTIKGVVIRPAK